MNNKCQKYTLPLVLMTKRRNWQTAWQVWFENIFEYSHVKVYRHLCVVRELEHGRANFPVNSLKLLSVTISQMELVWHKCGEQRGKTTNTTFGEQRQTVSFKTQVLDANAASAVDDSHQIYSKKIPSCREFWGFLGGGK